MKTILITGVAGFVGSNLAQRLLDKGYQVRGIDNLSQGFKRNIEHLSGNPSFIFYEADVCEAATVLKISEKSDCIVHLAAYKIPRYGNALATLTINTKGTESVLEAARKNKCKVVFSSTSDVYGKNPQLPFSEKSAMVLGETTIKRWAYAVSKIYDEHLCFAYQEEYGVPIVILRYFGGYGPHQNLTWRGGPQSVFINAAFKKERIPIHGDGTQTRSFTYIADIVESTVAAVENEKAAGEVINVGSNHEICIKELAVLIWKMINKDTDPLFEFLSYDNFSGKYEDVQKRVPDITKAKNIFGFVPKITLEEGLAYTIDWQRKVSA